VNERRDNAEDEERQGPVVRDNRRIDPVTGEVRKPADTPPASAAPHEATAPTAQGATPDASVNDVKEETEDSVGLKTELAERTLDLQRLQAEYSNYRKRVERDRQAVREVALANVLQELIPVLDDLGRAREHNELTGAFKQVGEALETIVGKLGLERFGEKGDPFDPTVHEALMHSYSADVTEPTAVDILQPGYTVAGRVLRPARVAVAEPDESTGTAEAAEGQEPSEATED
jgi:molecular chaperone GrpE